MQVLSPDSPVFPVALKLNLPPGTTIEEALAKADEYYSDPLRKAVGAAYGAMLEVVAPDGPTVDAVEEMFSANSLASPIFIEALERNLPPGSTLDEGLAMARNSSTLAAQFQRRKVVPEQTVVKRSGLASVAHPHADPDGAARRNIQYRQELARWKALPAWKRAITKKPDLPPGVFG